MNKSLTTWEQAVLWLRDQPEQQELVRACYYDDPLLEAADRFSNSEEWLAALKLLPQTHGSALDLGAGRGISSYALAKAGWQVTAVEPDPSPIVGAGAIKNLAHQIGLPIRVFESMGEQLEFPDASFDLVYMRQTLHHANDLDALCREVGRVLKPDGYFLACREHVLTKKEDLSVFLKNHPLHHLYGGENALLLDGYLLAIRNGGLMVRQVLGSYDSIINYFPADEDEILLYVYSPLRRFLGLPITRALIKSNRLKTLQTYLQRLASWRDQNPGRLYTFVAVKPK